MDYESRKVKWYWLLLYLIYCGAVVYLLFQGNPFLYSHNELRSAMDAKEPSQHQTIPSTPDAGFKVTNPTSFARYNAQHTGVDPVGSPRGKNYEEFEKFPVDWGGDEVEVLQVAKDSSGFYISNHSTLVTALGLEGKPRWKYRFKDAVGDAAPYVLLDENTAYLIHPKGEVVALNKSTGEIRWLTELRQDVVAMPLLWHGDILLPSKSSVGMQFNFMNRATGLRKVTGPHVDIKPGFLLSTAPQLEQLIATVDNKVLAIDPEDWTVLWTQVLTDPVKGHAVVVGSEIFVATLGAKLVKMDGAKKGKVDWEADLEKPPVSEPAFLPVVNRLAVMDTSGALSTVDAKTGKVYWRAVVEGHGPGPGHETWAARLSGKYIEEFKMDWLHKGWSIWSTCGENHFCIYTPNKGQLINRLTLSGRPLGLPIALEKRWVFLVQSKPGQFELAHMVEEGEIKRLRAAGKNAD